MTPRQKTTVSSREHTQLSQNQGFQSLSKKLSSSTTLPSNLRRVRCVGARALLMVSILRDIETMRHRCKSEDEFLQMAGYPENLTQSRCWVNTDLSLPLDSSQQNVSLPYVPKGSVKKYMTSALWEMGIRGECGTPPGPHLSVGNTKPRATRSRKQAWF